MTFIIIQTTNASFHSTDEGSNYQNLNQAKSVALGATLDIARDEILAGNTVVSVDVVLKDLDGLPFDRMVVTVSVAPLFFPEMPEQP
jgi:hypothetical protein